MDFGRYKLVRRIAEGGMGEVYLARLLAEGGFEKRVCLKLIRPQLAPDQRFVELFTAEAKLAARLSHPGIAQVLDFGRQDDTWFMALEYVEGADLRALCQRTQATGEPMPVEAALAIGLATLRALEHAHGQRDATGAGVLHRDVSPANLLISRDGHVKLTDFGLTAVQVVHGGERVAHGKLGYASPEQVRGDSVDARTDVFGVGMVLHELLAGAPPRAIEEDTDREIAECPVLPLALRRPDLPLQLCDVVDRAVALDATSRFESVRAMSDALTAAADAIGIVPERANLGALFEGDEAPSDELPPPADLSVVRTQVAGAPLKMPEAAPAATPKRRWMWAALALLAAGAAAAALAPEPAPPKAPRPTQARSAVRAEPKPPPPKPATPSPEPAARPPASPPVVTPRVAPRAPRTPKVAVAPRFVGWRLDVKAAGAKLFVDGAERAHGRNLDLTAGAHVLRLMPTAAAAASATLRISLPSSPDGAIALNADASPWAELQLGGAPVVTTPAAGLSLRRGAQQLRIRWPSRGAALPVNLVVAARTR